MSAPSSQYTRDERWAVATLHRTMAAVEPDCDALLAGALARSGPQGLRRRRITWVAAAAVLLLVVGTLGVVVHDATQVAEPAAPATPAAHLDGRTAALYLARLTGMTPTDYGGSADDQGVRAELSFDGHRSKLALDRRVTLEPTDIEAYDLTVSLEPATPTTLAATHTDGIFACSGRWLDDCETSEAADGTALTTGSALTANGCCEIRTTRVTVVAYQRTDDVVVWAEGRPDMFSTAQLTAIAMSPVWDLQATPSAADADAADALLPY